MGFREKSAWVVLIGLLIVFGGYFIQSGFRAPVGGEDIGGFYVSQIGLTVALIVLLVIGHIIAALTDPRRANDNADERERLIEATTSAWGGQIATAGALLAIILVRGPEATAGTLAYWVLFAVAASEAVTQAGRILAYRGVVSV